MPCEDYIRYEPQLYVMICRLCHNGVTKNGIARHYRGHRDKLSIHTRRELIEYSKNFDLCENDELPRFNNIVPPIKDLAIKDGVRCLYENCNYACLTPSSMRQHCEKAHGWITLKGIVFIIHADFMLRSYVDQT